MPLQLFVYKAFILQPIAICNLYRTKRSKLEVLFTKWKKYL